MLLRSFEAELSSTLDALYEAPFFWGGGVGWDAALCATADFLRADCVDLSFFAPLASQCMRLETARIDITVVERYMREFMADPVNDNPRGAKSLGLAQGEYFLTATSGPRWIDLANPSLQT